MHNVDFSSMPQRIFVASSFPSLGVYHCSRCLDSKI